MDISLVDLQNLANTMSSMPDDRPPWMLALTYANDEPYYRFFHEMAKKLAPLRILEIGTSFGTSAAHLAYANRGGHATTIDIDARSAAWVDGFGLDNLTAMTVDSASAMAAIERSGPFDVLFIDSRHEFEQCRREYLHYRNVVRDGGIIFFDDIHLDHGMERAWAMVADPKVDLSGQLHYTGFGACKVDRSLKLVP
jgi:predicted O-methyltransferase YrrM